MTKKNFIVLTVAVLAVVGFYLYLFRDSLRAPDIQISHTIRPSPAALFHKRPGFAVDAADDNINFGLNGDYRLTSVKVVSDAEFTTNKYAHPLWELVTESNSAPIRVFTYGMHIRGMHPSVKGALPGSLEANTSYRLFVQAGKMKGEHIFKIPDAPEAPPQPQ